MSAPVDTSAIKDMLLILGTASVVVPLMHKLKVSPVLGFLGAGAVLGQNGIGSLTATHPWLQWLTVSGGEKIGGIAEFGIVFLLFVIGLELSWPRLMTMRRMVFGLGSLQVVVSSLVIGLLAIPFGLPPAACVIIGSCLSLSSTAIVVELLAAQGRMAKATGRVSFAVLLFQDLAVVPILFLVGVLGSGSEGGILHGLGLALLQAVLIITIVVGFGRILLRPLFRMVAETDSPELFMAATLLVAVGTGVLTQAAGLSMSMGAFIAGLLLAETEYRRAIETAIGPFKGLLLGVFFFSVGMGVDIGALLRSPLLILGFAIALVAVKALIFIALARGFKVPWPATIETALLLGPGGEFAFIVIGIAMASSLLKPDMGSMILTVVSVTMAALPLIGIAGRKLSKRLERPLPTGSEVALPPGDGAARAIVVGFGRVGQLVSAMLEGHKVPYLATDRNATNVARMRRQDKPVYYGDAANPLFLRMCGLDGASALIITINIPSVIDEIVRIAREIRPDIIIVARARDAEHARHLYALGVTDAVPETIEASLQLSEAALAGLRVPMGLIIASIHEKRDEFRHAFQEAAGNQDPTSDNKRGQHSLRNRARKS